MAKQKQWRPFVIRKIGDDMKEIPVVDLVEDKLLYTYDVRPSAHRELLVESAQALWGGVEGRDFRIVQDQTVIGFHAKRISDGEAIEIR
jgi:hypothetical protein